MRSYKEISGLLKNLGMGCLASDSCKSNGYVMGWREALEWVFETIGERPS